MTMHRELPEARWLAAAWIAWAAAAVTAAATPTRPATAPASRPDKPLLKRYDSRYYVIHSDLPEEMVQEASARMTAMAQEYWRRTKGFGGTMNAKLPFYLFRDREDYDRCGGPKGSSGFYNGKTLVATMPHGSAERLWSIVQHEAFHQFAHRVIGGRMPVWVNEGLAEYFGQGVWTGDEFVTGLVSAGRLKRVRDLIRDKKLVPFQEMVLDVDRKAWNDRILTSNYDQVWSMVHFLVHGDSGRYRDALVGFIEDLSQRRPPRQSFESRFGRGYVAFQERYERWWLSPQAGPTTDLYVKATVATLTSYLARAHLAGLRFGSAEEFFAAAGAGKIPTTPRGYRALFLPPSLLEAELARAGRMKAWSLGTQAGFPVLKLRREDGTAFVGAFKLQGEHKPIITVTVTPP